MKLSLVSTVPNFYVFSYKKWTFYRISFLQTTLISDVSRRKIFSPVVFVFIL